MLVLSRREDERILIGDDVEIVVVKIRGGRVQLGIQAANGLPVHRKELRDRIVSNGLSAGKPATDSANCHPRQEGGD